MGYGRNLSGEDFVGVHIFSLDSGPMEVTTEDEPDGTGQDLGNRCLHKRYLRKKSYR